MTALADAPVVTEAAADTGVPRPLMLYDGECGLCDKSLRFVLDHDRRGQFHFAPLQSDLGQRTMTAAGLDPTALDSITLFDDDGGVYRHSTAVWRIGRRLDAPWRYGAALLRLVPRPVRDLGYRLVARHRIGLFGTANTAGTCSLLPPDQRRRIHL